MLMIGDGIMYRRKPNRGSKPAKKAGTAADATDEIVIMLADQN